MTSQHKGHYRSMTVGRTRITITDVLLLKAAELAKGWPDSLVMIVYRDDEHSERPWEVIFDNGLSQQSFIIDDETGEVL